MSLRLIHQTPQEAIDEFWTKFTTKAPGKATTIIPQNEYAERAARQRSLTATGITTTASYEEAAALCRAKVQKISKECRRVNQKYRDPHFDLESDLKWGQRDTLETLCNIRDPPESKFRPKSVKRVVDIFDNPRFYIDGPTASDVRQGRDGDCWLLAALCTLSNKPSLIERCCVAHDQQVGVYGFVFHRDGEWISEIIDDKLFLTKPDFDESFLERMLWEDRERVNSEEQYRRAYQSGSGALYFAQCEHVDETWLPLLEKAYAKAHGDYAAIEGGYTGEGIEDLTGGVTSELYTADILDKEYFWKEELMKVNEDFLFGCSTGMWGIGWGERKGIVELHAYSVMRAVEIDGERLVLLKNPWGKGEWKGAWSETSPNNVYYGDGSKEWTAAWMTKLDHRFGDDGSFWISYPDLLHKYQAFDRTRLFGPEWQVTSLWTTLSVPWTLDYHDTQFAFSISQTGPVVLVLSQLDDRYYRGLEGQYRYELNFRLHKSGQEDYVVRSISPYCQKRSVNVELELEAGEYTVLLKVNATRNMDKLPMEEVVRNNARGRRDKLVAVGMSYDLAHSKGQVVESEEEKRAKQEYEKWLMEKQRNKQRQAMREKLMDERRFHRHLLIKEVAKKRARRAKAQAKAAARRARRVERAKAKRAAEDKHVTIQLPIRSSEPDAKIPSTTDSDKTSSDDVKQHPKSPSPDQIGRDKSPVAMQEVGSETNNKLVSEDVQKEPESQIPQSQSRSESPTAPIESNSTSESPSPREVTSASQIGHQVSEAPLFTDEDEISDEESEISSVSEVTEHELQVAMESQPSARVMPTSPQLVLPPQEEDEFEKDPWNAVVTVGLRIYHKVSRNDDDKDVVSLRVVRPNSFATLRKDDLKTEEEDDSMKDSEHEGDKNNDNKTAHEKDEGEIEKGLDVDDASKDATIFGDKDRRRRSIVPPADEEDKTG